ncbi:MAG: hypothetical protein LUF35_00185 [Lachnospiraceae bacterium]|nr:hypothetical protein [Lachnospiraceae bacterium]
MEKKQYHSSSYHRFYENYAEREVTDEHGATKIERVYVGEYYYPELSDEQFRLRKVLFPFLYVVSFLIFLLSGTCRVAANSSLYMIPFLAISVCIYLLLLIPMVYCVRAEKEMELRYYRYSHIQLTRYCLCQAVCLFGAGTAVLVGSLLFSGIDAAVLLCAAGYCAAGAFMLVIYLLQSRTEWQKLPPKNKRPDKSSYIRYEESE